MTILLFRIHSCGKGKALESINKFKSLQIQFLSVLRSDKYAAGVFEAYECLAVPNFVIVRTVLLNTRQTKR